MTQITTVLRELRSKNRRTQEYMGAKLQISQSQYNKIEKGEKPLEFEMLSNIAKIFGIQPKELFIAIYENTESNPIHKLRIDGTHEASIDAASNDNYYKKLATYFERRFLRTYRMYIELYNKHEISKPEESIPHNLPLAI